MGTRPGGLVIISNITEGAKRKVEPIQAAIETDILYPLIRGRDVNRWCAEPSAHIIMAQDPKTRRGIPMDKMKREFPKAYSYFLRSEKLLKVRAAFRRYFTEDDPFWTMFNIGEYTFAPYKVVWREVSNEVDAAVIGPVKVADGRRPMVPDHTCILIPCDGKDQAHYLCGVLNSSPVRLAIRNYIVLHPDPHVLRNVKVPTFSDKNRLHVRLAELSEAAHKGTTSRNGAEVKRIEAEADGVAAKLWDLSDDELAEIRASLEELG
jgi:hypothetical protein